MKKWFPYFFLTFLCLPVVWALFKPGFFITHDGEFNLVRLMHFDEELRSGQFPVRWAFDLNYRFGSPVFSFFYPLTYYLGSLIHRLGFDFGTSLKILIGGVTVASILVMYAWLAKRFSPLASLVGSALYLFVPYRLLTMYVTGSFGVLLSLLFVPLSFLAIDRRWLPVLSLAVFGLLTSHNVTTLILLPIVMLYALVVGKDKKTLFASLLLGFGLAAFFVLPALTETNNVFLSRGMVVNFADHFPTLKQLIYSPWGYFYSVAGETGDGMSFQVGMAQLTVGLLTVIALSASLIRKKRDEKAKLAWLFVLIFGVSFLLMLPVSKPIWETIPLLPQVQFPWRILAVVVVTTPFLAAFLIDSKFGRILAILFLALMLWNNRNYLRTWESIRYPDASYPPRQSLFYGSTDIAWETRPIWAEEKPVWLAEQLVEPNKNLFISREERRGTRIAIEFSGTKPTVLVVNQFYYPSFRASLDGKPISLHPTEKTGLLSVDLPLAVKISEGKHTLVITQGKTAVAELADAISLVSLLLILFPWILSLTRHKGQKFFLFRYALGPQRKKRKTSGWDGTLLQFLRNTV